MSLITVDLSSIPVPAQNRVRSAFFPLVRSETITNPNEVDDTAIKNYLDNIVSQRTEETEKESHRASFSYSPPNLG